VITETNDGDKKKDQEFQFIEVFRDSSRDNEEAYFIKRFGKISKNYINLKYPEIKSSSMQF